MSGEPPPANMTDLELLNAVMADLAKQLADAQPSTLNPQPSEIKDPAIKFFDAMMQPRDPAKIPNSGLLNPAKIQSSGLLKNDEPPTEPPVIDV